MKRALCGALLLVAACDADPRDAGVEVREELRGDTIAIISSGEPPSLQVDVVDIAWQSDELANPHTMARVGNHLIIGDGFRVHVLGLDGAHQRSFGSRGEGPGELQSIASVGPFGDDTVAVFDVRLRRVSFFSVEGQFLDSRRATPGPLFGNPSAAGPPLVRAGSGVLTIASGNLLVGRPNQTAVVWNDLEADTSSVVGMWNGPVFEELGGGVFGSRELFPIQPFLAIAGQGRIAVGYGHDYCLTVHRFETADARIWCRERPLVPIGGGIRSPDFSVLAGDPRAELSQSVWRDQDPGSTLPHFNLLIFSDTGDLWVRTLDESVSDIHPGVLGRRPDLAPPFRSWEVFDPEGRLTRQVFLPYHFEPRVILEDRAFGFWALETGEVTIGSVSFEREYDTRHSDG